VLTRDDLAGVAGAAFGSRRLVGVSRLRGGSKKGAYRLFLDDESTAVAYVWAQSENYWPGAAWRDARIRRHRAQLSALLDGLAAQVPPRAEYRLIHGEGTEALVWVLHEATGFRCALSGLVGLAGLEPATSATQTRRASQTALQPVLGTV
jgi:hypothetical protein